MSAKRLLLFKVVCGVALILSFAGPVHAAPPKKPVKPKPTLHSAIKAGDMAALNTLLAHGANPNSTEETGFPALIDAITLHRPEMVKALLAKGADPNANGMENWTALMAAVSNVDVPLVKLLIEKGAKADVRTQDHQGVLYFAASGSAAFEPLDKHFPPSAAQARADAPVRAELHRKQIEILRYLLANTGDTLVKGQNGIDNLRDLVGHDDASFVQLLLEKGVDVRSPDSLGSLPLLTAAFMGNQEMVSLLLAKGAEVNTAGSSGETALQQAALQGNLAMVKLLVEKGAKVNTADSNGRTALMAAAVIDNESIIATISEKVAQERRKNAAARDKADLVNYLIAHGADVNAQDMQGATALSLARKYGRKVVAQALKAAGGR